MRKIERISIGAADRERLERCWSGTETQHRIGDKRIIRLIRKWLKAGILEDGIVTLMTGERAKAR